MPVDTQHPDFLTMAPKWKRCRDVYSGQDAVHAAAEAYLPKLKDQSADDYKAYVSRATFYNATCRTITGLVGMIFRQEAAITVPANVEPMLKDINMGGVPLQLFVQDVATEAVMQGRIGVLVDYPSAPKGVTLADAKVLNLRPTMCSYRAEAIINWKLGQVKNVTVLVMVVLAECAKIRIDEFKDEEEKRWRVLDLDAMGMYRVRVFRKDKKGDDEQIGPDVLPEMGGKRIDYIPFVFIGTDDVTPEVDDPPLIDLVNMNLAHYRTTADFEHGCHFTGLPTAVISGYKADDTDPKFYIGSSAAWVFPSKDAKADYLEFTGQGLQALEDSLTRKEAQMAVLGARMLEPQKKGVETADTASIHRKGEESMLSSISVCISLGIERALKWFSAWAGATITEGGDEVEYDLNKDFYPEQMTPQEITALLGLWQAGAISDQTLFENLQAGEIISPDTTLEEEQARIKTSAPRLSGQPADGSAPPPLPDTPSQAFHIHLPKPGSGNKKVTGPKGQVYKISEGE